MAKVLKEMFGKKVSTKQTKYGLLYDVDEDTSRAHKKFHRNDSDNLLAAKQRRTRRENIIYWMMQAANKLDTTRSVFYTAVAIFDDYISKKELKPKKELKIALACLAISDLDHLQKYVPDGALTSYFKKLLTITQLQLTVEEIMLMKTKVRNVLNHGIPKLTANDWLNKYIEADETKSGSDVKRINTPVESAKMNMLLDMCMLCPSSQQFEKRILCATIFSLYAESEEQTTIITQCETSNLRLCTEYLMPFKKAIDEEFTEQNPICMAFASKKQQVVKDSLLASCKINVKDF